MHHQRPLDVAVAARKRDSCASTHSLQVGMRTPFTSRKAAGLVVVRFVDAIVVDRFEQGMMGARVAWCNVLISWCSRQRILGAKVSRVLDNR